MSVALVIHRENKESEVLEIATQRNATRWADIARSQNLKYVVHIDHFLVIDYANVDQVLAEVKVVRKAAAILNDVSVDVAVVEKLIAALEELRGSKAWEASIG